MKVTPTAIVLLIPSLFMVGLGIMLLLNKNTTQKFEDGTKYNKKKEYVAFNAIFNFFIGLIGIALVVIDILLPKYQDNVLLAYIVLMVVASILQKILNRKYK